LSLANGSGPPEAIAVIGMRGRFPGAPSVDALWRNLLDGVESISTFTADELRIAGIDPSYLEVPGYVPAGCVLEDVDLFDAAFFGYSARDAETIDPQQRVFMELAWESLEDAGYDADTFAGLIGVFAGSDQSSYLYQIYQHIDLSAFGYGGMMAIGNEKDYVATQVSYKLDLRGPSMAIQTSCSTSLVAVCMACQSLLGGGCDLALAGGVAIQVPQRRGYWYQPGGIVSPDGHCRPFAAQAQGTVVGNGVGLVVLKRLAEAIADGDRIHAVIKGFGLNNDGAAKVGYTAPSIDGQADAIMRAQRMAGVDPQTIGYVEAHGTATALGDPVEVAALTRAFRKRTQARQFCAIGSLKSNVGHLSSAAGVAGLIKAILAVEHAEIPKSLHYETPNPHIDFTTSPFFVAGERTAWPISAGPRRAAVSSFGVGGTNAHIILEEAPTVERDEWAPDAQLLVLSARTPAALEHMTDRLVNWLESKPDANIADVAYTLQVGRRAFPQRRMLSFRRDDAAGVVEALRARDPERVRTARTEQRDRPVVFMFSGQGTQYVDMGLDLYDTEPIFREVVDSCAGMLQSQMGLDLRDCLYPPAGELDGAAARLTRTSITQPALFTVEYALARLWMEWGVTPKAMLGHSIGEYVAACLAGVMELEDALAVVAMRGRLMESVPCGSMLAVALPEAALQPLLGPELALAAVNAPALSVLSGATPRIDALEAEFRDKGLMCRRLHTSHAFHSPMMEPIVRQFVERMSRVELRPPKLAYLSNVTGSWITPELAMSPQYWGTHLRQTVRFADDLCEAMAFPDLALLEIGPGQTLGFLARQQGGRANSQLILASLRGADEQADDAEFLRATLGALWMGGVRIDWEAVHACEERQRVPLPTYPFDRQRFWLGPIEEFTAGTVPAAPGATSEAASAASDIAGVADVVVLPPNFAPVTTKPAAVARIEDLFSVPVWRADDDSASAAAPVVDGAWLVFADRGSFGDAVATRIREAGGDAVVVHAAAGFTDDGDRFTLRPAEGEDYEAMVGALRQAGRIPARVVHCWSMDEPAGSLDAVGAFDDAQRRGFYSVGYLARALGSRGGAAHVQIGIVTDRLQRVTGGETLRPLQAPVAAAARVVPQEYPNLRCRVIDVVRDEPDAAAGPVRELAAEPFAADVAYRSGCRWTKGYEAAPLPAVETPAPLREDGVYLLTGGMGSIGLLLAESIARRVRARLVLCGRSVFPDRAEWDAHEAARPADPKSARIRRIRAIEALGAEVRIFSVDVADRDRVETMVRDVEAEWGRIDCVIHGAGNLAADAFAPVRQLGPETGDAQFRPKAHGLLVLQQALREQPPSLWVMLSSLSAVLGGLNLAAYAAANAFLDAAAYAGGGGDDAAWITTSWDAWDFAPDAEHRGEGISAAQGEEAFARILASGHSQVVVSVKPLAERLAQWVDGPGGGAAVGATGGATAASAAGATAAHARPELSTEYVAPRSATETRIAAVWEHLLGVAPIGAYDKFFELGGHSLLAIQLLAELREIFEIDLPVQRIFEAPTVAQLAETIEADLGAAGGSAAAAAAADDPELAEVLSLVEGLSEEELDRLLAEAEAMQQGGDGDG
jgi:acyl transferase domain-containing protein